MKHPDPTVRSEPLGREDSPGSSRREFLAAAGASAAGLALAGSTAASYARVLGANDRVRVGFVGVGNRGESLLRETIAGLPDVETAAVCDVYRPYLDNALARLPAGSAAGHADYRRLLDDASIDAVVVATPDHWHAKQFVDACRAGKDVYVEKPLSLVVSEGRRMVEVAAETGRVSQMGTQRRSSEYIVEACRRMREGAIGKITRVRCYHIANEFPMGIGRRKPGPVPEGLDWDMWLGPAPETTFDETIWNYKFRWFWAYSGGQVTNFGAHWIDVVHMALGQDAPKAVCAMGGVYAVEDDREVPDTMEALWEYDGCLVSFGQFDANAYPGVPPGIQIEFRGTLGTALLFGDRVDFVPDAIQDGPYPARGPLDRSGAIPTKTTIAAETIRGKVDHLAHLRNFFDCVRTRGKCACDVETGHRSTAATLIGNVALRARRFLDWDAKNEIFPNAPEANKLLAYEYRPPWTLE